MSSYDPFASRARTPRPWHRPALDAVRSSLIAGKAPIVAAATGCHAAGQLVLMFDGSLRRVEDVRPGDALMGPDSLPRRVLALCRGSDRMYDIVPTKGDPWTVNADHVLTLVDTRAKYGGRLRDVAVAEWLRWGPNDRAMWKLFRVGVEFEPTTLPLDPYFLGLLLGDGGLTQSINVTTMDAEIVAALHEYATRYDCILTEARKPGTNKASTWHFRGGRGRLVTPTLRRILSELGLMGSTSGDKAIPPAYLTADRASRLEILAGLIDTDGSASRGGYDFISKSPDLANGVAFLARSLGMAAYVTVAKKGCQTGATGFYFRVSISGDCGAIPVRLSRKRVSLRCQIKSVTRTGFSVRDTGRSEPFFGFVLDGDHRYLLGDFTVTHNSGKSYLISGIVDAALRAARPHEVVIVTAPRQKIVEQLVAEIAQYVPDTGVYYGKAKRLGRVVVACNASAPGLAAALDGRPVRMLLVDEAHRSEADELLAAVAVLNPRWRVGVTATPFRSAPGETLSMFDEIAFRYTLADGMRDGALVPFVPIWWERPPGVTEDPPVDELALQYIRNERGPGVVDAENIEDAVQFAAFLQARGVEAYAVHSEMRPATVEAHIARVRSAPLDGPPRVLSHVNLLSEGVDIPELSWLVQRKAKRSPIEVVQQLGRVLRESPGKSNSRVYDPHARLAKRGLATAEAIGEAIAAAMDGDLDALGRGAGKKPAEPVELPLATAVCAVDVWCATLAGALEAAGLPVLRPALALSGTISDSQLRSLRSGDRFVRYLPASARDTVRELVAADVIEALPAISAANLIGALKAVDAASARSRKSWTKAPRKGGPIGFSPPKVNLPALPEGAIASLRAAAAVPSFDWSKVAS